MFLFSQRRGLLLCALPIFLVFISACTGQPEPEEKLEDKVIAMVDKRPIMRSSLDRALEGFASSGRREQEDKEKLDDEELKGA